MRQTLITLLAVITLLSQWGWLEHDYQAHDPGEVCEVCVSAAGHVAITPSAPQLPALQADFIVAHTLHSSFIAVTPRFYVTRAPPRFL